MEIPENAAKSVAAVQPIRALTFWPAVRVASGNFLEMYDFQVFGYYAAAIARTFSPSGSEFASLMPFGAGFLMRPIGAIVLGAYIDHRGRAPQWPSPDFGTDGDRDRLNRLHALLCIDRADCAVAGCRRAVGAGTVGRRRGGRRLRLSFRGCDARTQRFLRQLASGEPASGGYVRSSAGARPDVAADRRSNYALGMADPSARRLRDYSAPVSVAAVA